MNFQAYDPLTEAKNLSDLSMQMFHLAKAETALTTLPADVSFAIVAAVLEREASDNFWTTTLSAANGGVQLETGTDNGYEGRFNSYFAIAGSKFRVYKDDQLYLEDDISHVSAYWIQNKYIIQTTTKKFKVDSVIPIARTEGRFQSNASGLNGGLNPLFDILEANGASIARVSGTSQAVYLVVFLVFVAGVLALIFLKK